MMEYNAWSMAVVDTSITPKPAGTMGRSNALTMRMRRIWFCALSLPASFRDYIGKRLFHSVVDVYLPFHFL